MRQIHIILLAHLLTLFIVFFTVIIFNECTHALINIITIIIIIVIKIIK